MQNSKLIFFVSPQWRRDALHHTPLLFPFWGNPETRKMPFFHELFERHTFDTSYYDLTENIEEADLVLLPYSYANTIRFAPDLMSLVAEVAAGAGKPLLIDGSGDISYEINIQNTLVLRHGGYRFLKKETDIQIPFYADDLLEIHNGGTPLIRQKQEKPSISFAGWASLTPTQEARAIAKELPDRLRSLFDSKYGARKKGIFFRREAIRILASSSLVQSNFLIRTSYSGHTDTAQRSPEELRREFIDNLLESDYALDVRGDANNTIRLFESLSLGRIPVIVDTERNFPFENKIDYKEFSLMVDFRDLPHLSQIIADFHASLSPEQFVAMQHAARRAYLHYFRVDALTRPLIEEIRHKLKS